MLVRLHYRGLSIRQAFIRRRSDSDLCRLNLDEYEPGELAALVNTEYLRFPRERKRLIQRLRATTEAEPTQRLEVLLTLHLQPGSLGKHLQVFRPCVQPAAASLGAAALSNRNESRHPARLRGRQDRCVRAN